MSNKNISGNLFDLKKFEGLDVDEKEDFYFAEYIFNNKKKFLK